jgi:hypothetical protein
MLTNRFLGVTGLAALASLFLPLAYGGTTPKNLANGLYEIVEQNRTAPGAARSLVLRPTVSSGIRQKMLWDETGKVMVDIHLDGSKAFAELSSLLRNDSQVEVTAEEPNYQSGVIEGYVTPEAAARIASSPGVRSLSAVLKPIHYVGLVTTQGVHQHEVDKLPAKYDGSGISVGVLSDSYNTSNNSIKAETDISTGDLPGPGNPLGNTTPVTVLEDFPDGTDEGRAMLQIVHDIAPKAKLAFATADDGEVGFANNIKRLKDEFNADVIIDDVFYFDEPLFQDGIIAQAVDYVAAKGVAYFSSAGNQSPTEAYASKLRRIPFDPSNPSAVAKNTNLDLSQVDPSLYIGGFHNFRQGGQDIAQTVHLATGDAFTLQWNDGYQTTTPNNIQQLFSSTGALTTPTSAPEFTFSNPKAGDQVRVDVFGTGSTPNLDVVLQLIDPNGQILATQDTGTGETMFSFLPTAGNYTVRVTGFQGAEGQFTIKVNETDGKPLVGTDLNLLIFDEAGNFLGALADNNLSTNRPVEVGVWPLPTGNYQFVISYGNVPAGPQTADQVRYVFLNPADSYVVEYVSVNTPSTGGHSCARGANGVGAYSPFRPYIPEDYSAHGPETIYFDGAGNRLSEPEVRLKPDISAMDGGNTTFFVSDTSRDDDTFPNFFGTSASAPHAGGIAALVLQSHGGPGSLKPTALRAILQQSAFPHDLDPYQSTAIAIGRSGIVLATVLGDDEFSSQIDTNQFTIGSLGFSPIHSLTIDLHNANPTGGNIYHPYPGEVFDTRPPITEFEGVGLNGGFPFTVSPTTGIPASVVSAAYGDQAPAPSVPGQFFKLALTFQPRTFNFGSILRFGIDRDEWHSAFAPLPTGTGGGNSRNGGSADLLGGGAVIPGGNILLGGATIEGTFEDGSRFSGRFVNLIGHGYSPLDGWGFINAQAAVLRTRP